VYVYYYFFPFLLSVLVLNCESNPFHAQHMFKPKTPDDEVTCIATGNIALIRDGRQIVDMVTFAGFRNGTVSLWARLAQLVIALGQ
jgi:hypothetical protein